MAERFIVSCGSCDRNLWITPDEYENNDFTPCPVCPDGGADLIHARRHGDDY